MIFWYADDLKVRHIQQEEVEKMIHELEERFGKMSTVYGSDHTCLGMCCNPALVNYYEALPQASYEW